MPKPELTQRKGNVYWTPTRTPDPKKRIPPNVDPRTGEIIGKRMEHQSDDNIASWWQPMIEMGESCVEIQRRTRRRTRR